MILTSAEKSLLTELLENRISILKHSIKEEIRPDREREMAREIEILENFQNKMDMDSEPHDWTATQKAIEEANEKELWNPLKILQ